MMFALIITGLILKKVGVVGKEVQKGMTNLVIDLILPCNIIYDKVLVKNRTGLRSRSCYFYINSGFLCYFRRRII